MAGKNVCVTSGFVAAMKGKGIEDIVEIENTGKTVAVKRFTFGNTPGAPRGGARGARGGAVDGAPDPNAAPRDILIPEVYYPYILTHDAWGDAMGVTAGGLTYPMLFSCDYATAKLYVLTVPNDPSDFYALPQSLLSVLRANIGNAEPVRLDNAPAQVALFRYDNNAFIVQNYLSTPGRGHRLGRGKCGFDPGNRFRKELRPHHRHGWRGNGRRWNGRPARRCGRCSPIHVHVHRFAAFVYGVPAEIVLSTSRRQEW